MADYHEWMRMDRPDSPCKRTRRDQLWSLLLSGVGAAALFLLVARHSQFLTIDSGPYLSVAHNLVSRGWPDSNIGVAGNFNRLPSPPNFIVPGLSFLVATVQPLAGDPVLAAKIVLLISLAASLYLASRLLIHRTGAVGFGLVASLIVVSNPNIATWAGVILTELPFIACMIGTVYAAVLVLEGRRDWWIRGLALPVASALLCLTRFIGVFLPPIFSIIYLIVSLRQPGERRILSTIGYLAFYNCAALAPTALWLLLASTASPSVLPPGQPSSVGFAQAAGEAATYLFNWLSPWAILTTALWLIASFRSGALGPQRRMSPVAEIFIAAALAGYVGLIVTLRSRRELFPLNELGARYIAPAWALAGLAAALLFHRLIWQQGRVHLNVVAAIAGAVALWSNVMELAAFRLDPTYPTRTETYLGALEVLPERAVVLCNFGQTLSWARPDAVIICIPSRQDWRCEFELKDLVNRHRVEWMVLFDYPDKRATYPEDFARWLVEPPQGVPVVQSLRFADGMIHRLAPGA